MKGLNLPTYFRKSVPFSGSSYTGNMLVDDRALNLAAECLNMMDILHFSFRAL